MKRFHFSLERVRQWRQTQVDVEYSKLQKLFAEMRRIEGEVTRLVEQVHAAEKELEQAISGGVPIDSMQLAGLDDYRLYAKREEKLLEAQQEDLRRQIGEQRNRLIAARRNSRLLDKLKDRAKEEWETAFNREIEDMAAELHLANWNRNKVKLSAEESKPVASCSRASSRSSAFTTSRACCFASVGFSASTASRIPGNVLAPYPV